MRENLGIRFVRFLYKHLAKSADYPLSIQVAALTLMAGIIGLLYLLKSRFMPLAFFVINCLDLAGGI